MYIYKLYSNYLPFKWKPIYIYTNIPEYIIKPTSKHITGNYHNF